MYYALKPPANLRGKGVSGYEAVVLLSQGQVFVVHGTGIAENIVHERPRFHTGIEHKIIPAIDIVVFGSELEGVSNAATSDPARSHRDILFGCVANRMPPPRRNKQ